MKADEVLIFPRGQLSPKDKEKLTRAGIVAVEADTPHQVTRISMSPSLNFQSTLITGDALVVSALQALASQKPNTEHGTITASGRACYEFVSALANNIAKPQN